MRLQRRHELADRGHGVGAYGHYSVARLYPGLGCGLSRHNFGHIDGYADFHRQIILALADYGAQQGVGDAYFDSFAVAQHPYARTGLYHVPRYGVIGGFERLPVEALQYVAVTEACSLHLGAEVKSFGHCMIWNHVVAPVRGYSHIYTYGEDKVQNHACHHYA